MQPFADPVTGSGKKEKLRLRFCRFSLRHLHQLHCRLQRQSHVSSRCSMDTRTRITFPPSTAPGSPTCSSK